jgi:hypothetical protein
MTYPEFVNSLAKPLPTRLERLNHSFIGMLGELGELADVWKKHELYEQPLDTKNILEELGDFRFYLQITITELNWDNPQPTPESASIDPASWPILKLLLRMAVLVNDLYDTATIPRCYNLMLHYDGLCKIFNVTDEQVREANMDKLRKRYPDSAFSTEHAKLRLDKQQG